MLFQKEIELPAAKAGTTIDIRVYVDYAPGYQRDSFLRMKGYTTVDPATIEVGGSSAKVVAAKRFP